MTCPKGVVRSRPTGVWVTSYPKNEKCRLQIEAIKMMMNVTFQ